MTRDTTTIRGPLAGLGAATAAVLIGGLMLMAVWHRISGQVGDAVTVLIWLFVVAAVAAVVYELVFLGLRLRHHVIHPETLTRYTIRAEDIKVRALPAVDAPAVPAPAPVAALPPPAPPLARMVGMGRTWRPPGDPDTYPTVIPGTAGDTTEEGK